jgi:UV DNA damage endonuclease
LKYGELFFYSLELWIIKNLSNAAYFLICLIFDKIERGGIMSIGYASNTIGVKNTKISRCILKNATDENLHKLIKANLQALETMVDYNIKSGIRFFRINSDVIPFASNPINQIKWWIDYKDELANIGNKIKCGGIRITIHPNQYTILNSNNSNVVQKSFAELVYHSHFIDSLGLDSKNKIIVYIGWIYKDKESSKVVFIDNFHKLSPEIKAKLVIENDEKNYNIEDALEISKNTGIPVVFNNLSNKLNLGMLQMLTDSEYINLCGNTWKECDGNQIICYSQLKDGDNQGKYSDTIQISEFIKYYRELARNDIDIMLEVNDKNLSAVKCIKSTSDVVYVKELEEEWARYKYYVLSRYTNLYSNIRNIVKVNNKVSTEKFYNVVEQAMKLSEDKTSQINAVKYFWGFIDPKCTENEKRKYNKLFDEYKNENGSLKSLKNYVHKCAKSKNIDFIEESYYFYL